MKRRTFIFQTGTLITTAMLAQCNTSVGTKTPYTIRRPNPNDFKEYLFNLNLENSALLLMSSGNYGGLNFDDVKVLIE